MSPDSSDDPVPVPFANLSDPQSLNLYAYVYNNPLSNIDPDGHTCQTNSSDRNVYDDGDGNGCSQVDDADTRDLQNGKYSARVTAPYDTSQLQEQAAQQQYRNNLQSLQPAQISLAGKQFIQIVAQQTEPVNTALNCGAYSGLQGAGTFLGVSGPSPNPALEVANSARGIMTTAGKEGVRAAVTSGIRVLGPKVATAAGVIAGRNAAKIVPGALAVQGALAAGDAYNAYRTCAQEW